MKTCNHCSTELKLGTNWQENRKKVYINLCDDCYKTRQKKYQKERQSIGLSVITVFQWVNLKHVWLPATAVKFVDLFHQRNQQKIQLTDHDLWSMTIVMIL